jgi:zinc D-Ala-D-Ala carboxypeptidase|tara:strand:+ start:1106 stop:1570 length:465 start_codon:yes stop_codon:yes gene_type:complete
MISKHISEKEATKSVTALRMNIDNTPNGTVINNMKLLAQKVFEPLRLWVGGAIKINSFYRSRALNDAIGGSTLSQHCQGRAMDIDDVYGHKTNKEMFYYIKENINFDQMIWEFGNEDNPDWIHISYVSQDKNRNKILKAVRDDGKTKYIDITNV